MSSCLLYWGHPKSRKRDGPKTFLAGYTGYLQADAYAGYDCIYASGGVIEVACMAHCRRKFIQSLGSDRSACEYILTLIQELYRIERDSKSATCDERRKVRLKRSAPLLHQFKAWMRQQKIITLPKSPLGKAIVYAENNWRALCRYLCNGELEIDNNAAERAMRPIAVGRKNWLFAGSREGGKNAAIIASIVATCKLHDINPRIYIADVLSRMRKRCKNYIVEHRTRMKFH